MKRRLLVRAAAAAGAAALVLGIAGAWLVLRDRVRLVTPPPTLLFEDVRGRFIAELSRDETRLGYWALPGALPERIVKATLAAEDARYWEHGGVDWRAVARAAWQNAVGGYRRS